MITKRNKLLVSEDGKLIIPKGILNSINVTACEVVDMYITNVNSIVITKEKTSPLEADGKKIITVKNEYDGNECVTVKMSEEQYQLLEWLADKGFLDRDIEYHEGIPEAEDLTIY